MNVEELIAILKTHNRQDRVYSIVNVPLLGEERKACGRSITEILNSNGCVTIFFDGQIAKFPSEHEVGIERTHND